MTLQQLMFLNGTEHNTLRIFPWNLFVQIYREMKRNKGEGRESYNNNNNKKDTRYRPRHHHSRDRHKDHYII